MSQDYKIILTALNQTQPAFDQVRRGLGDVGGIAKTVGLALAGLGAGVSLNALVSQFNKVVESAAGLKDAAERTGSTVEQMGALSRAAKLTGQDFGLVETGIIRLTKALAGQDDEARGAARALDAIGLSIGQLRQLDPAQAFQLIAQKLAGFEDSAAKTAIALDIFGKNGAQLLPFLKDMVELGELNSKTTREQAYLADEYSKNILKLTASKNELYKTIGMELLPVANAFVKSLVDATSETNGLKAATKGLAADGTLKNLFTESARAAAAFLDNVSIVGKVFTQIGESIAVVIKDTTTLMELAAKAPKALVTAPFSMDGVKDLQRILAERNALVDLANQRMSARFENLTPYSTALEKQLAAGPAEEPAAKASLKGYQSRVPTLLQGVAEKAANDPLADAAKSYGGIMGELNQAQSAAMMSGLELTATQRKLATVMASPEFAKMPEPWRELIAAQGEAAIAAEQTAAAEQRLNSLIAATPTAKLEAQRDTMQFLAKAFEDGKISAQQFEEASQAALGTLPELAKDGENAFADLQRSIEGWGRDSADAIVEFATTGKLSFAGLVNSMIKDLMRMIVYQNITKPLAGMVSGGLSGLFGGADAAVPMAKGGVVQSPSLSAYSGGVYDSPRLFAFARGAGIFGEAGPEAIMPLRRGADGKLGVVASGGGDVTVNVTVAADGASRNDGSGNLAQLGTVIANVVRAELINQKRPGGLLAA